MKRLSVSIALALWLGVAMGSPAEPLRLTATTSLLSSLLKDIGGEHVQVNVLIPPASCPGHFDLRPGDVAAISRSGVLFAHQFERFVDRVGEVAGKQVQVYRIAVPGNWLVPGTYVQAAENVAAILSQIDPTGRAIYQRNLKQLRLRTIRLNAELQTRLKQAGAPNVPVVGSEMLEPLLQSGANTGAELARELGAQHVMLSNFPGGFANTLGWENCLRENVRRVAEAVKAQKQMKQ